MERTLRTVETALEEANKRFDSGTATESGVLQAQALVLDVKIRLLRERAQAPAK